MTSRNLATVFLPALFFSVQGDKTSAEEIMKMAVLGKAVSNTLAYMIDNPELDPDKNVASAAAATGPATIPAGLGQMPPGSPQQRIKRGGSAIRPQSAPMVLKKGSRRRSLSAVEDRSNELSTSGPGATGDGKLSAESVLAALRKAKDAITRRGGSFQVGDGSTFIGKRGWLTLGKKQMYFVIVNDWVYWFREDVGEIGTNSAQLAGVLGSFVGNVNMARCNIVSRKVRELEVIQPSGPNVVLLAASQKECEDWLYALVEISIAGFPLPLHLNNRTDKEGWVSVQGQEKMYAVCADFRLILARDEKKDNVYKSFQLDAATVAKGKTADGSSGFVVADVNGKVVVGTHNPGEATEWVNAIKLMINLAWCKKYEPERMPKGSKSGTA